MKRTYVAVTNVALMLSTSIQATTPFNVAELADAPVWVQVATAGTYKGYAGGEMAFTFDLPLFKQVIANFRTHPSYKVGADGIGEKNVVAWDFHHASEMPAVAGSIPVAGAPAQGWIRELDARVDDKGLVTLWALTKWLEPARSYIKEERYQWSSVSIVFDAVHAVTGKPIGAVLTSVALTNQPFIEGMQPLAADKAMAGKYWRSRDMYIEAANNADEALETLRRMLGMPETADAATVIGEIAKVAQWVQTGQAPLGVDVAEIIGGMRTILNLPTLSSNEEVMAEVTKLITRLQEASGVDDGTAAPPAGGAQPAPAPTPANPPPGAPALQRQKENEMEILKTLADKLGTVATEAAVLEAVDGLTQLRAVCASAQGHDSNTNLKVILKTQISDADVRAKFVPLLKALGVEDPDAALDKVGDLMTQSEELKKVAPELAALRKAGEAAEEQAQGEDVEAAMASMGIASNSEHYEGIKLAVSHYRKSNKREDFYKKYPKAEAANAHLTRTISATTTTTSDDPKKVAASRAAGTGDAPKDAIDIGAYSGANLMMKACGFVQASVAGAQSWPWAKVHEHASALVRSKKVFSTEA